MGILKALACCSLFLSIVSVGGAKAMPSNASEMSVEINKCLTPLAHSIFEQVYKMPYKDEYQYRPGGVSPDLPSEQMRRGTSTRDCSEPTSPSCLHFQNKEFLNASWGFYGQIPTANPAELEWRNMVVNVEAYDFYDLYGRNGWATKLNTSFSLNSGMSPVYLNALELLPQVVMVSDFEVVGRDFVGREIITPKGSPRFELFNDTLPPLSDSSALFNGDYPTQIRVNLRSYDECIRKLLK